MSADMVNILGNLMPVLEKYNEVEPEYVNIKVLKYDEGVVIKIKSDAPAIGEALAEILGSISQLNTSCEVKYEIEDLKTKCP